VGQQWYLDAFLRSQTPGQGNPSVVSNLTILDMNKLHPLGEWYNFAMTYDGTHLQAYVNGQLDLPAGALSVLPMAAGQTSLGMRFNQVNFFEGVIAKVRFTSALVDPEDFLLSYVPGDFDRNGLLEAADYAKWKSDFGNTIAQAGDGADGNRDGIVDAADYTVWRDAFSASSASAPGEVVPEPVAAVMAGGLVAMMAVARGDACCRWVARSPGRSGQ